jgi:hypothetical protein
VAQLLAAQLMSASAGVTPAGYMAAQPFGHAAPALLLHVATHATKCAQSLVPPSGPPAMQAMAWRQQSAPRQLLQLALPLVSWLGRLPMALHVPPSVSLAGAAE